MNILDTMSNEAILKYVSKQGGQSQAARALGVPRTTLQKRVYKAEIAASSARASKEALVIPIPKKGTTRLILSSVQDNTEVDLPFLLNLEAYSKKIGAPLYIAGFTYQKGLFEDHSKESGHYASEVGPYLCFGRIEIGEKIAFCGEMNTLPTAARPLSSLDTYTKAMWGIFPHPKIQLVSVPTMKFEEPKQILTTGTVSRSNYVPKKAGLKADFHHVIGAVIVEIDSDGDFFVRHLKAAEDGSFQDLDVIVKEGVVTSGHRVLAVNWGDIHVEKLDPLSARHSFGFPVLATDPAGTLKSEGGIDDAPTSCMLDDLMPEFQFMHDTSDFAPRNHHNIADPHFRFQQFIEGTESVETALQKCGYFLSATQRSWCQTVVVESNHDLAYLRWLKTSDYKTDPANAEFFLESQLEVYRQIAKGNYSFSIFAWAMHRTGHDLTRCEFLREDDSFIIAAPLHDPSAGIQCAMHGHLGANGARPSPTTLIKIASKLNIGHVHSPYILDGVYASGLRGAMDMGYNKGASGWSPTDIITYHNGNRTLVTTRNGKYRCAA